jgi:acetyl-CoA carboxylase biotin carboxyl carrier protein
MNANDIETIVKLFKSSGWREMQVRVDGGELFLSTDPGARMAAGAGPVPVAAPVPAAAPVAPPAKATIAQAAPNPNWLPIVAPNLGTFYRAPKPGSPPLVEIGQRVEANTEICLLEVMKLFTAVTAGVAGTIVQVCVQDAELVEGGRILFYIEKA